MAMDLKRELRGKLEAIAPEYGMVELSYPSFVRCYGYYTQPLAAADAVEALNSLLDAATGVPMEVEIVGARNGGEWFGGGHVWHAGGRWATETVDKIKEKQRGREGNAEDAALDGDTDPEEDGKSNMAKNFWSAFDALDE